MQRMKVASVAFIALVPLLASCASSGLYNMSDDWCSAHAGASEARCPKDPERAVHNDKQRVADNEVRSGD
jgi:hypothetical protein